LVDVPESSGDEGRICHSQCLEDPSTLNPHFDLFGKVEFDRLNPCPEAIDMAFIDPSFANWALGRGRCGIDKDFTHLRSPP
jgi:hypothetical protein